MKEYTAEKLGKKFNRVRRDIEYIIENTSLLSCCVYLVTTVASIVESKEKIDGRKA